MRLVKFLSKKDQEAIIQAIQTKNFKSMDVVEANKNYAKLYGCGTDDKSGWPECFLRETLGHDAVYETA